MIPDSIDVLDILPRASNGKVNLKSLPKPTISSRTEFSSAPPTSEVEMEVAAIFSRVLRVSNVSSHDNFFDLGGNSLLLLALHSELQRSFSRSFALSALFQCPTVNGVARLLQRDTAIDSYMPNNDERVERRRRMRNRGRRRVTPTDV
jgi:acyl carrier protein